MNPNFDEQINRRNTYSVKWDGAELIKQFLNIERYDEHTIPLFIADMDFAVPEPVIAALHRTVDHRIFGYSMFPDTYYEAIQHWFRERYSWEIHKEEMIFSPGTVHAIQVAIRTFTEPGDGVIIQRPVYPPFTSSIEQNGRIVRNNALIYHEDGSYSVDFDSFEQLAREERTKLFLLCNPHNPTGKILSPQELRRLSDICRENNVLIVADEIHGDLIRSNQSFTPLVKVIDDADHVITCTAINKTFNVAGLHCSNIIISNPALRDAYRASMGMAVATPFAISALIAAYQESASWLEHLKTYLDETIEFALQYIHEHLPKVKVKAPEGTYIMWLDFRDYGLTAKEVHDRIYNRANVLLEDGEMFGEEGTGFQRICVCSPRSLIAEALERIAKEFEDVR